MHFESNNKECVVQQNSNISKKIILIVIFLCNYTVSRKRTLMLTTVT